MSRTAALVGSGVFFLLAPGAVAGLAPWLITHWRFGAGALQSATIAGAVLIVLSGAALVECFLRFALTARGTPAPVAPTEDLVITGLYRRVRNPMYVAVTGLILGQALFFGSAALIAYAVAIWTVFHLFVLFFEEPRLRRDFPEAYRAYFGNVPRWIPRLTPWRPS